MKEKRQNNKTLYITLWYYNTNVNDNDEENGDDDD